MVAGAMRILPLARASRKVSGFALVSTMRLAPRSSKWVSSGMRHLRKNPIDIDFPTRQGRLGISGLAARESYWFARIRMYILVDNFRLGIDIPNDLSPRFEIIGALVGHFGFVIVFTSDFDCKSRWTFNKAHRIVWKCSVEVRCIRRKGLPARGKLGNCKCDCAGKSFSSPCFFCEIG